MKAPLDRTRALLFALLAATLSSCSSNSDNPVTPESDEGAPSQMVSIIGSPKVKVRFEGYIQELPGRPDPGGMFSAIIYDTSGIAPTFLNDVRLQDVVMHEERDPFNSEPFRYVLNVSEMGGVQVGDTIRFDVLDGGAQTPPFSYRIVPSYLKLPPDSTVLHQSQDLVLYWTGAVERVLLTITDITNKRIRFNYQVENYTGGTKLTIPARDLAGLQEGPLFIGTNIRDTEVLSTAGPALQQFELETRQDRVWLLVP